MPRVYRHAITPIMQNTKEKSTAVAPQIHITINPSPTLTMIFHFHTCSSGSLNAPPVNNGSAGSDCVGDGLCDVVVTSSVVPLADEEIDVSTLEVGPSDGAREVLDIAVVEMEYPVDNAGGWYVAFPLPLARGYPLPLARGYPLAWP